MSGLEATLVKRVHPGLRLDLRLKVGPDDSAVLFGPSGAGKTTALRMIAGLTRPDSGRVTLDGSALYDSAGLVDRPLRARRVGLIFQDDLLFPHLRVVDNLRFGLKGWPRDEMRCRVAEVAELCGVSVLLDRWPGTLSGGERQRVGLARVLAPRPRLLLADEPVSALDLDARFALLDRLGEARRAEGIPLLLVTHSPAEAVAVGSRLFLLESGRIVAEGAPLDVLASRTGPEGSRLDGLRNVFRGTIESNDAERGETVLRLAGGPSLIVPYNGGPVGSSRVVTVRADDVLLAGGPVGGLSARNVLPGVVERVVPHGSEAEVVVRVGETSWIVSVVASAVAALGLVPGSVVSLILKARACRVLD